MNNFNINKNEFTGNEIVSDLRRQMAADGIDCDQEILIDGKIHRFSRDRKQNQPDEWYFAVDWVSSKNAYYLLSVYGSWSDGSKFVFRSWDKNERFLNEKERLEIHEALQKRQKEAEKLIEEEHARAAELAKAIWDKSATTAPDEEYLAYASKKGIHLKGARFTKNLQGYPSLVIPLFNLEGEVKSLQFISVGEKEVYKTFFSGGEKKGNFMVLGNLKDQGQFLVAEGYATACSCHEATGLPAVVAFDSGNLPLVVKKLRSKFPRSEIIICGDNDSHRENNPGKNAAIKAAIESNCRVAIPSFFPENQKGQDQQVLTDFNDLLCLNGPKEVARQIEGAEVALNFLLDDLADNPLEKTSRDYIFSIAYLAIAKGDLSQRDIILSQLHEILKPFGIEKVTLRNEFKQFVKDQGDQVSSSHILDSANFDEKEEGLINALMEAFGNPIPFNHNGKPKGINQMFFASKFAKERNILYEPIEHAFHEYHTGSGLWEYRTDDSVKIKMGEEAIQFLRKLGLEDLVSHCTETLLRQLIALVKGKAEQPNAFQRKRGIIHVANGIIKLNENPNILHGFDPGYFSRNRSNIAVDLYANCPRFIHELLVPAISREDIVLLQKYCGQCLLGYNPSQTILLMPGTAGGGKSTLVSVIEKVIGIYNVAQLKVNHLSERFEVASFFGKTLLTGKDVPGNFLHNPRGANVLKSLVGGDRLSAEQKNLRRRFDIVGEFNVIITSNARLHLRLDSDIGAWQRRLLIIEFEQSPPEKPIPHFDDLLVNTEGPGILNWMIEGAKFLLHDLNVLGRIQRSPEQKQRVDDLLAESDSIVAFVQNCIERNQGGDVTVSELSEAYTSFCQQRDWNQESIAIFQSQVKNVMLQLHHVSLRHDIVRNSKNQRGFKHVSLINQEGA